MRSRLSLVVVTMLASVGSPADGAGPPNRQPSVLQGAVVQVRAGDDLRFECTDGGAPHDSTFITDFAAYALTSPTGEHVEAIVDAGSGHSEPYAAVRVGDVRVEAGVDRARWWAYAGGISLRRSIPEDGTARIVWAAWGQEEARCMVAVNGSWELAVPIAGSRARYLIATDFDGVAASNTAAAVGAVGAHEQEVSGYIMGFFAPVFGRTRVEHPSGETEEAQGRYPWLWAFGDEAGSWRFSYEGVVDDIGGPILWLVDLPF